MLHIVNMITKILKTGLFSLAAASLSVAIPAYANLKLSDFYIDLHEKARSDSIYAANQGKETMYLKISVVEVINPGAENQEIRKVTDPKVLGLLVSPQRLVVKAGEEGRIPYGLANRTRERSFLQDYRRTPLPANCKARSKSASRYSWAIPLGPIFAPKAHRHQ